MSEQGKPRLIEVAFPLKQASLDSVHEKMCHNGHIKAIHNWPARRPLAACRAALIATLLPDPGNEAERKILLEKLAGTVKKRNVKKTVNGRRVSVVQEYTEGGILRWGQESGPELEFFREAIKKAYGGRAPRVLDPFAGGGAIPLEAMRLGCDVTAVDLNPVAWFVLKCTLEHPQRLAGQKRPLPRFALESDELMAEFLKKEGKARKNNKEMNEGTQSSMLEVPEAGLGSHVRAWGWWVLERAKRDVERFYLVVDDKPSVAYLWARTVTCKNCRATLPLLKTLWLCRKGKKRVRLDMKPREDRTGVNFTVVEEPVVGGNAAQCRAHDLQISRGTMSKSGVWCPVCGGSGSVALSMNDIKACGMSQGLGAQITAVVTKTLSGKKFRAPNSLDSEVAREAGIFAQKVFDKIPFGLPKEAIPGKDRHRAAGSQLSNYGFKSWADLFTGRQLAVLGTFVKYTIAAREFMVSEGYSEEWTNAIVDYLACVISKLTDYNSTLARWQAGGQKAGNTFVRWALPMVWDFAENNMFESDSGGYAGILDWVIKPIDGALADATRSSLKPNIIRSNVLTYKPEGLFDCVFTDPPYYDAIPYSDLMDYFYVWLRRVVGESYKDDFYNALAEKGPELIQHHRTGPKAIPERAFYETGMSAAFRLAKNCVKEDARLVVVFANKEPAAWETLATSIINAGFVVEASWPIETEMPNRSEAMSTSSLASSVWLVCRKRPEAARPGWEDHVLEEMRANISKRLSQFWDAGIKGPDLIWAATGPALEAYSRHPFVKKADRPDAVMPVSEFLQQVRRIVTDYMVGHLLSANGNGRAAEGLDDVTLYYLLHRQSFGFDEAPVGACILYAQSCKLADRDLTDKYDLLAHGKGKAVEEDVDEEASAEEGEEVAEDNKPTSGSTLRLKKWDQRPQKDLGMNQAGKVAPLIDQVHRIMRLWRAGDVQKVDAYIETQGIRRNPVFPRLVQALIEMAGADTDERRLLENIQNQITARGAHPQTQQLRLSVNEEG